MLKYTILFLSTFIVGCTTYPSTYNPEEISQSDLAKVTYEKLTFWERGNKFKGYTVAVYDENRQKVIQVQESFGYGTKVHEDIYLPEGTYLIIAYCTNNSVSGNPKTVLSVNGGNTYTLACNNHTEKGFLGLEINKSVSLELLGVAPSDVNKKSQ